MGVTLDQILILAGRLDDSPGFDTPRERFRRFLIDHVRDLASAKALIEECQYAPGEQHQRALEDLVVLLGRFIGFETTFGTRRPGPEPDYYGIWRSRLHLRVIVDVKSDQTTVTDVDRLTHSLAAASEAAAACSSRAAALRVLAPLGLSRPEVEETFAAARSTPPVGVTSLAGIAALAEIVSAARLTHEDAVRLFESNVPVEFIVQLLEKVGDVPRMLGSEPAPIQGTGGLDEPRFWMAVVVADHATEPEEFLESVVAKRRIFGLLESAAGSTAQPGDWICFSIPGKGIVGHARVASLAASGAGLRDAHRFRQLLQLEHLDLHLSAPVTLDSETQLRLRTMSAGSRRTGQTLIGISRESFRSMTGARHFGDGAGAEPGTVSEA